MSVHMVDYTVDGEADSTLIDSYLPQWLITHSAWQAVENEPPALVEPDDAPPHYPADWWFSWGDNSKDVLLNNLVAYSQSYSSWGRVRYHVCNHDESERSDCKWDDSREWGNFPVEFK